VDFLPPPPTGGPSLLKGGHAPLNQARGGPSAPGNSHLEIVYEFTPQRINICFI